jgi:transcriptional regulator with XRE-family HTH domain
VRRQTTPLKNLRRSRTLNQTELARIVGISQQHLSKIERGLVVPTPDLKARLAAVLGVSVPDVFAEPEAVSA